MISQRTPGGRIIIQPIWILFLRNYNIRDGQGPRLALVIRVARIGVVDLMVLTENKITNQAYCQISTRYDVFCSKAIKMVAGDAQGVVGLFVRDQPQGRSIESTRFHGSNVVIYEVFTGKHTPVIDAYLPLSNLDHLPYLEEALTRFCYH